MPNERVCRVSFLLLLLSEPAVFPCGRIDFPDLLRRNSCHNGIIRRIMGNDCTGANQIGTADFHAGGNGDIAAQPGTISDANGIVIILLGARRKISGSRVEFMMSGGERTAGADQYMIFNGLISVDITVQSDKHIPADLLRRYADDGARRHCILSAAKTQQLRPAQIVRQIVGSGSVGSSVSNGSAA